MVLLNILILLKYFLKGEDVSFQACFFLFIPFKTYFCSFFVRHFAYFTSAGLDLCEYVHNLQHFVCACVRMRAYLLVSFLI